MKIDFSNLFPLHRRGLLAMIGMMFAYISPGIAQDPLHRESIKGLRKLSDVDVVMRAPDESQADTLRKLNFSDKLLLDEIRVSLNRHIPTLRVNPKSSNWLVFSWVSTDAAAVFKIELVRWVRITETNESAFVAVWDKWFLLSGDMTYRQGIREKIDELMVRFAADYLDANK